MMREKMTKGDILLISVIRSKINVAQAKTVSIFGYSHYTA